MADQKDVRLIALSLPETRAVEGRFAFAVKNGAKEKAFVWAWMMRVDPKKGRVPSSDVVAVRVAGESDKQMLLASDEAKFFTEPHYDGFPAVMVRLPEVDARELRMLLTDAWRCQAPRKLVATFEGDEPAAKKSASKKKRPAPKARARRSAK